MGPCPRSDKTKGPGAPSLGARHGVIPSLARAELALHLRSEDFDADHSVPSGVHRVRAGSVELEFTSPTRSELPDTVLDALRPLMEAEHSLRLVP